MDSNLIIILAAIVILIVGLVLALYIVSYIVIGAGVLLAYAGEQEFLGLAAYIACWVFLFPVMLVISLIVGFLKYSEFKQRNANTTITEEKENDYELNYGSGTQASNKSDQHH